MFYFSISTDINSPFLHSAKVVSPGHCQNWIYDFLCSDWLTQNQNIAWTAKGLRPKKMASEKKSMSAETSHNKLQQY